MGDEDIACLAMFSDHERLFICFVFCPARIPAEGCAGIEDSFIFIPSNRQLLQHLPNHSLTAFGHEIDHQADLRVLEALVRIDRGELDAGGWGVLEDLH